MNHDLKKLFYKDNKVLYALSIATLILSAACLMGVSVILQMFIDVAADGTTKELKDMIIAAAIFIVVFVLVLLCKKIFLNRFIKKAMIQYKSFVISKVLNKNINAFSSEPQSTYISALTNDIKSIEANYLLIGINIIVQFSLLILGLITMGYYSIPLLLLVIVLSGIQILISGIFGGKLVIYEKNVSDMNGKFIALVKDILTGFSIVKSFKIETQTQKMFDNMNDSVESANKQRRDETSNIELLNTIVSNIITFSVLSFAVYLAIQGDITVGTALLFVQLLNFVTPPIGALSQFFAIRKSGEILIKKMEDLINSQEVDTNQKQLTEFKESIVFDQVSFRYDEGADLILKNISVELEKNKKYVIVGGSGSGKSTMLNMLLGYHKNYGGNIYLDNQELRTLSLDSVYDSISVIQQNVFIFDSSIYDNITLFEKVDDGTLDKVINQAGLDSLIKAKGFDYQCGENGSNLSGGEKQRISIARCLLRNTPIILMDEATSALDTNTSKMIEQEILKIDNLTRIVITHKLEEENMKQYDCIIALNNGYVEEQGTFDELIENKKYFYSLYMVNK